VKPKNLCLVAAVMALSMVTGLLTSSGTAHAAPPLVPHYECYGVFPSGPPPTLPTHLTLETQFGTEVVENAPIYTDLCLPAQKKVGETWVGDLGVPHVECVPIAGESPVKIVHLETQWGIQKNVEVGEPIVACMPASKTFSPPPPQPPEVPHYECFQIHGESPLPPGTMVTVRDQFDPVQTGHLVEVGEPTRLCLPAIKNGHGSLDPSVPHVECFAVASPFAVEKYPYLLTQFGPYQEVQVIGPPRELCLPVLKTVVDTSIGGIAEAPDADASALEATTTTGGSSTTTYAVIAGIAAGIALLGAGGWYARRRWLS